MAPLVSVIIPAYNSERTIRETLGSARAQTYANLEIIVVNDGSTDSTPDIAQQCAREDGRCRLVSKRNAGVASARNRGIAAARGAYIAPLDADDLWHPTKIARQVELLENSGPGVALVYNWFRKIDEDGKVIPGSASPVVRGRVFHQHLAWNFISNGSTPLIRTEVLKALRYETSLRASGNEGCEDYLLQLRLARAYRFECVPAYLTGYRRAPGAMSTAAERMIRSHIQVYRRLAGSAPPSAQKIIDGELARLHIELARNRLRRRQWSEAVAALGRGFSYDTISALAAARKELRSLLRGKPKSSGTSRHFFDYSPSEPDGAWQTAKSRRKMARLQRLDKGIAAQDIIVP